MIIFLGEPTDVENNNPNAHVTFSNIKFGTIGSTYDGKSKYLIVF